MQNKPKSSVLERIIYLSVPFVGTAIIVLMPYVGTGMNLELDSKFIAQSVLTIGVLLSFYFCFRSLFTEMYLYKDRIVNKVLEYSVRTSIVYNGHLKKFDEFCTWEFEERKKNFITRSLQIVNFGYEEFVQRYKFSIKLVRNDETLSTKQKCELYKLMFVLRKMKRQDYEKVLPGTESGTVYKRVHSSMNAKSKFMSAKKVLTTTILGMLTISFVFTMDMDVTPMGILLQIFVRLASSILQIVSALFAAKALVNKSYFSELSEKNLFLHEYIEWDGLTEQYYLTMSQAKKEKMV